MKKLLSVLFLIILCQNSFSQTENLERFKNPLGFSLPTNSVIKSSKNYQYINTLEVRDFTYAEYKSKDIPQMKISVSTEHDQFKSLFIDFDDTSKLAVFNLIKNKLGVPDKDLSTDGKEKYSWGVTESDRYSPITTYEYDSDKKVGHASWANINP